MNEGKIKKKTETCLVTRIEPAEKGGSERGRADEIERELNDENTKG